MTDETERQKKTDAANAEKQKGLEDLALADKILEFSTSLSEDAALAEREAQLNEQYAGELEKAIASKDQKALDRSAELQKEITELSQQKKQSENLMEELRTGVEEKQKQQSATQDLNENLAGNIRDLRNLITEKETELEGTKKKKQKKNLENEISSLKLELAEKEADLTTNQAKLDQISAELNNDQAELAEATRIKEETKPVPTGPLSADQLRSLFKDRVAVTNPSDKSEIQQSINELNNFNKEIDKALAYNK
jgi:early endosome antigen 1